MTRTILEEEFTIFDTETTGLDYRSGDRVVEIAGIRFKGQQRIAVFNSLVNTGKAVSPAAFEVNKISPEMLLSAPGPESVLPKFLEFIRGSYLCSYNANFDLGFLDNELKLCGLGLPRGTVVIDILLMAKKLLSGYPRYALWFVARQLGINIQQDHRALADVELTLEVFNRLRDILVKKDIIETRGCLSLFSLTADFLDEVNSQKVASLREAIDSKSRVRIKYLSSSYSEVSLREVLPKEIKQERNFFYLVGFCYLRNEERTFKLGNILQLEVLRENSVAKDEK